MDPPPPYPQEAALADLVAAARADVDRATAGLAAVSGASASADPAATAAAAADAAGPLAAAGRALAKGRALLREFEQEARLDGMPPPILAARRRPLAEQLAALAVTRAAALSAASAAAAAAAEAAEAEGGGAAADTKAAKAKAKGKAKADKSKPTRMDALSTPELIAAGRFLMAETDASLFRSARSIAQTVEVGTRTAAALADQAAQLERILDDADAMRGAARRGRRVIVDVARGAATDRCIALLILLIAGAGVAALALRVKYGGLSPGSTNAATPGGRRLLGGGGGGGGWVGRWV